MNKYGCRTCPPKKKMKKQCDHRKLGAAMLLLGVMTILAIFLPVRYWVVLLSAALVIFGVLLLKK